MRASWRVSIPILRVNRAKDVCDQRHRGNIAERKEVRAETVIDVVGVRPAISAESSTPNRTSGVAYCASSAISVPDCSPTFDSGAGPVPAFPSASRRSIRQPLAVQLIVRVDRVAGVHPAGRLFASRIACKEAKGGHRAVSVQRTAKLLRSIKKSAREQIEEGIARQLHCRQSPQSSATARRFETFPFRRARRR